MRLPVSAVYSIQEVWSSNNRQVKSDTVLQADIAILQRWSSREFGNNKSLFCVYLSMIFEEVFYTRHFRVYNL